MARCGFLQSSEWWAASLTATLRDLEMDGFVTRTVTPSIPPRVDYELTELGRDLQKPLDLLGKWAVDNRPKVLKRDRCGLGRLALPFRSEIRAFSSRPFNALQWR